MALILMYWIFQVLLVAGRLWSTKTCRWTCSWFLIQSEKKNILHFFFLFISSLNKANVRCSILGTQNLFWEDQFLSRWSCHCCYRCRVSVSPCLCSMNFDFLFLSDMVFEYGSVSESSVLFYFCIVFVFFFCVNCSCLRLKNKMKNTVSVPVS